MTGEEAWIVGLVGVLLVGLITVPSLLAGWYQDRKRQKRLEKSLKEMREGK